jgi:hypothetical protein
MVRKFVYFILVISLFGMVANTNAGVIYYDSFDGTAGTALNGTTPDVSTTGASWAAGADFDAAGTVTYHNADGSLGDGAYLPFKPQEGYVYVLSAFIDTRPSALRSNNPNDWMALGFARTNTPVERRFYDDPGAANLPGGDYWMMSRTNLASGTNYDQDFIGYRTNGGATGTTLSANNLSIVLDTTVSTAWTVEWFFDGISQRKVTVGVGFVNDPFGNAYQPKSDFNYIMISNNRCDGFIDNVMLTPEPATMVLMGLGSLSLLRRKKS